MHALAATALPALDLFGAEVLGCRRHHVLKVRLGLVAIEVNKQQVGRRLHDGHAVRNGLLAGLVGCVFCRLLDAHDAPTITAIAASKRRAKTNGDVLTLSVPSTTWSGFRLT